MLAERFGLGPDDICYVSMPLFHSNAVHGGLGGGAGAAGARSRCGASSPRRSSSPTSGATARPTPTTSASRCPMCSPPRSVADDADNPLRVVYGNEGAPARPRRGSPSRFGALVVDGFGSTEGGVAIGRTPDTPPGSLGPLTEGTDDRRRRDRRAVSARRDGRAREPAGRGRFRGLLQRRRRRSRADGAAASTTAATSATATTRLCLLRGPARRLDAGRRREPRHRADRTGAAAPPRRHRGRRVRRSPPPLSATR